MAPEEIWITCTSKCGDGLASLLRNGRPKARALQGIQKEKVLKDVKKMANRHYTAHATVNTV